MANFGFVLSSVGNRPVPLAKALPLAQGIKKLMRIRTAESMIGPAPLEGFFACSSRALRGEKARRAVQSQPVVNSHRSLFTIGAARTSLRKSSKGRACPTTTPFASRACYPKEDSWPDGISGCALPQPPRGWWKRSRPGFFRKPICRLARSGAGRCRPGADEPGPGG